MPRQVEAGARSTPWIGVIGDQMYTGTRDQRGQALDEREWIDHEMGRAITPSSAQLVDDLAVSGEREALGGDRASCDIAAEVLEADPVVGSDANFGVQGEAVLVRAESAGSSVEAVCVIRLLDQALDAPTGLRPEGDASLDGGGGEEGEDGIGFALARGVFFARGRPEAAAMQQA